MKGKLLLTVITPTKEVLNTECDEVTLPGKEGYFGILPGHVPLLAALTVGELRYRIGKIIYFLAIDEGFCDVADDSVRVLVEEALKPEEIDIKEEQKKLELLRKEKDWRKVELDQRRAATRVSVATTGTYKVSE